MPLILVPDSDCESITNRMLQQPEDMENIEKTHLFK